MKMNLYKILAVVILINLSPTAQSQSTAVVKEAEKAYNDFGYVKTAALLEAVVDQGYGTADVLEKLANALYFNNEMQGASKWYGELLKSDAQLDSEVYFRYAQALKYTERYEESDRWMAKFQALNQDDLRAKAFASTRDYLDKIKGIENNLELKNLAINSPNSDFGIAEYNNKIVFSSSRGDGKIYKWNAQPFLELYTADKTTDTSYYSNVMKFSKAINTDFHESSATFSSDERSVYFTRNLTNNNNRLVTDKQKTAHLGVYKATRQDDGSWADITPIGLNSKSHSVAHLTINTRGNKVYFSADFEDTVGASDLYVADFVEGQILNPVNLGKTINTEGSETFPFVNSSGDLFFSSNGYPGLGGLDVYVVRDFEGRYQRSQPMVVENFGRPINSAQDDFGYYENVSTKQGFISSNRPGGKGDDDIYLFSIPKCSVSGIVLDGITRAPIPSAVVDFYDGDNNQLSKATTDDTASFSFAIDCSKEFVVRGSKQGYSTDEKQGQTLAYKNITGIELLLNKSGVDLGPLLDIDDILFDFDKSDIRPDAALKLDRLVEVLTRVKQVRIEIGSHTDSRGDDTYNLALSERRAQSTMAYLIAKGIDKDRLTAKGYGESELTNGCSNGVGCSEQAHQENRRSAFIVVNLKD